MLLGKLVGLPRSFKKEETGAVGLVFAVAMPVIVGIAGLAVDYGVWKKEQVVLQRTADSAVYAAAIAKAGGASDLEAYARANAIKNGFDISREELSITDGDIINVEMERTAKRYFSSILTTDGMVIGANAAAEINEDTTSPDNAPGGYPCITALKADPEADRGIYMHDNAYIDVENCGVYSNATDVKINNWIEKGSIYLRNGDITASSIQAVGEAVINDWNGASTTSVEPQNFASGFVDPFAALTAPSAGACSNNGRTVNYVSTPAQFQPGTYCGDIIVQNGGKASFAPGVYNIINGDFLVRGGASIFDSTGVTFYFGGNSPGKWIINNGTNITLSAPVTGDTAGMLFWQSADAVCNFDYDGQNKFAGGVDFYFEGVIYAPNCGLVIDNNSEIIAANQSAHISIHAAWIEMAGNTRITAYGAGADSNLKNITGYTDEDSTVEVEVANPSNVKLRYYER